MSDFRPVRTDLSFGCLVFATICLQKFALPSGEFIGVPVIALWGILLWLMSRGVAVIDPFRAALFAIILFGIVLIFVHIPHASLIYSILGLVIFAGLTMFDFQRLRRSKNMDSAPLIAASIFLDALNVFLFFLRIFSRSN